MFRSKVLIIDDEAGVRFGIRDFLENKGFDVEESDDCGRAVEIFQAYRPDAVFADYMLPDGNALDLIPRLKAIEPDIPVVILTAHGSIDLAVRAIKEGAEQFLTKPIELLSLLVILERLLENARNRKRQIVRKSRQNRRAMNPFIGSSGQIREVEAQANRILSSDSPVLISGETGTGKGVLARWLHENGPRADESFVDLNCAGLSRDFLETELFGHEKGAFTGAVSTKQGLLEVAHRGTVFLDEIGDMDIQVQPKLLKALEEKRIRRMGDIRDRLVDIRLMAASHQDLPLAVKEKRLRSDLYFRINTIPITIPPLRSRPGDVGEIATEILGRLASDIGRGAFDITSDAVDALSHHPWPGNIRELRNVLERAILLAEGNVIMQRHLRFDIATSNQMLDPILHDTSLTLEELEEHYIKKVLAEEQGRVEQSARRLGIPRSSLYQKIKHYQSKS